MAFLHASTSNLRNTLCKCYHENDVYTTFHWKHVDKLTEREKRDTSEHSRPVLLPQGTIYLRIGSHSRVAKVLFLSALSIRGNRKGDEHHGITCFCIPPDAREGAGIEILGRGDPGAAPKRIPCIPPPPGLHRATRVPPTNTASGYSDHIRGGGRSPAHVQGSADIPVPVSFLVSPPANPSPRTTR